MRKLLSTAAAAAALFVGVSTSANAYVVVNLQDVSTGSAIRCDNSIGDGKCTLADGSNGLTFTGTVSGLSFSTSFGSNNVFLNGTGVIGNWSIVQSSSTSNSPGTLAAGNIAQTALTATNTTGVSQSMQIDVAVFGFSNPPAVMQTFSGTATIASATAGATASNQSYFYADPLDTGALLNGISCTASIAVPSPAVSTSESCPTGAVNWLRTAPPQTFSLREVMTFTASAGAEVTATALMTTRNTVPEPTSTLLVGAALLALAGTARRKV